VQFLQLGVGDFCRADLEGFAAVPIVRIGGVHLIPVGVAAIRIDGNGPGSRMMIPADGVVPVQVLVLLYFLRLPLGYEGVGDWSGVTRSLGILDSFVCISV